LIPFDNFSMFWYLDARRYRLGVNCEQMPVNTCPCAVANDERDGHMRVDGNGGSDPNYSPNSFDDIYADPSYKELPMELESTLSAISSGQTSPPERPSPKRWASTLKPS